jgi:formamidopyrimidine-DNA glycosylase
MPELPEVETIARGLEQALKGDTIDSCLVLRPESIAVPSARLFPKKVTRQTFKSFRRRGKYLLVDFQDGSGMVCHLRMSGRLIVVEQPETRCVSRFLRTNFKLVSGRELHFEDMRVFGRLWFKSEEESFEEVVPGLASLGPEPWDVVACAQELKRLVERRSQAIKLVLLDQTVIAGIGNIYADEALFAARINPLLGACELTLRQWEHLLSAVRLVLERAIAAGGTTLRDYTNSQGVNGNYQNEAAVYGRTGETCRNCYSVILRVRLGGRSCHYCPTCQKDKKVKA